MRDIVIIVSIASVLGAIWAIGVAAWHHCRLQQLRNNSARRTGEGNPG